MHEYSIVQALLERVEHQARAHRATQVHRVQISIGDLAGVEIELLRTAYDTIRYRTMCQDAELEIRRVEACWTCSRCDASIPTGAPLRCATCGAAARLKTGDEIMLDRIEMEAA